MRYRMKMNMPMRGLPSLCDRMNDVAVCDDDLGAGGRIEISMKIQNSKKYFNLYPRLDITVGLVFVIAFIKYLYFIYLYAH